MYCQFETDSNVVVCQKCGRGFAGTLQEARSKKRHCNITSQVEAILPRPKRGTIDDVTIAVTAFERPWCLEKLVASIRRYYPTIRIVVADNGEAKADVEVSKYLVLPYNCGIAMSRNMLVREARTPYIVMLEDDFEFTEETKLERFIDVLDNVPEAGLVGGANRTYGGYFEYHNGEFVSYSCDFDLFRGTLSSFPSSQKMTVTEKGTPYRICDMTWNFFMARRELFDDHLWDDRLRVAEHYEFFWRIKKNRKWRVAYTPSVVCNHDHNVDTDPESYKQKRRDTKPHLDLVLKTHGLRNYVGMPAYLTALKPDLPNAIVLTTGRSGSTILSKMMASLGWNAADMDEEWGESIRFREINEEVRRRRIAAESMATEFLDGLPAPWVLKDPRFMHTAKFWLPLLKKHEPTLLWITRDEAAVLKSHQKQGWTPHFGSLDRALERCSDIYKQWPWGRATFSYEQLREAVSMFDLSR